MEVIGNLDPTVSEDRRLIALDSTENVRQRSRKHNRQIESQGRLGNGTTAKGVSEVEHSWLICWWKYVEVVFQLLLFSQQNKKGLVGGSAGRREVEI